jgi:hypothetical protein
MQFGVVGATWLRTVWLADIAAFCELPYWGLHSTSVVEAVMHFARIIDVPGLLCWQD